MIAFPDRSAATQWYESPAYQAILPLRTTNSTSVAAIVEGVLPGYRAVDGLADLLGRGAAEGEPAQP